VAPVGTRWKSDFDAMEQALADREYVDRLCVMERQLKPWLLTDEEWNYIAKLKGLLEVSFGLLFYFVSTSLRLTCRRPPTTF
jgi:hypothetical protein